jgi:hypothetical protein
VPDPTQDEIDAAYHEAAHAIAHIEMGYPLEYVSINPPQDCKLGGTKGMIASPELEPKLKTRKSLTPAEIHTLRDEMTNYVIGELAEARLRNRTYGLDPHNVRNDDERQIMGRASAIWGTDYSTADAELEKIHLRAEAIVASRWQEIEKLAAELLERKTVTGDEAAAVISGPTAPKRRSG